MVLHHGRSTISLSWRLTAFFVLFGVVLSIFSFCFFERISTHLLLKVVSGMASAAFSSSFPSGDAEELHSLFGSANDSLEVLARSVPFLSVPDTFSGLSLYAKGRGDRWFQFHEGDDGFVVSSPVASEIEARLDAPEKAGSIVLPPQIRRGREYARSLLALPVGTDGTRWALGVDVKIHDLSRFLLDNGREVSLFAATLLALAVVLGNLFARWFTKPILALADSAERYGQGEEGIVFGVNRRDEIGVLSSTLGEMTREIEVKSSEIKSRLATMEAMNRIDKAVLSTTSRTELFRRVADIVSDLFSSDAVVIALRTGVKNGWEIGALHCAKDGGSLDSELDYNPFAVEEIQGFDGEEEWTSYYESSIEDATPGFAFLSRDLLSADSGRVVSAPLFVERRYLGILALVVDKADPLDADERRDVRLLADQTAVALRGILEHEAREENFLGVIQALTRAIDAKSKWTAGHSERVADTSMALGRRLGLSPAYVRQLRIAAILHDAGKIGVNEAILDKPGRLDPVEFEEIKRHPVTGGKILSGIRALEPMVPAVVHHHESWDGTGYPEGLAGADIPLFARIIKIADVWDAITDDRPYRKAMPREEAMRFMADNGGKLFDPELVSAFLRLVEATEAEKEEALSLQPEDATRTMALASR